MPKIKQRKKFASVFFCAVSGNKKQQIAGRREKKQKQGRCGEQRQRQRPDQSAGVTLRPADHPAGSLIPLATLR